MLRLKLICVLFEALKMRNMLNFFMDFLNCFRISKTEFVQITTFWCYKKKTECEKPSKRKF